MAKAKIQITVDRELLEKIDAYAKDHFTSRSGVFSLGASQLITTAEMKDAIKTMSLSMKKIADEGKVSEEDLEKMRQFMGFAAVFNGE